jgi:hypothetical protein
MNHNKGKYFAFAFAVLAAGCGGGVDTGEAEVLHFSLDAPHSTRTPQSVRPLAYYPCKSIPEPNPDPPTHMNPDQLEYIPYGSEMDCPTWSGWGVTTVSLGNDTDVYHNAWFQAGAAPRELWTIDPHKGISLRRKFYGLPVHIGPDDPAGIYAVVW